MTDKQRKAIEVIKSECYVLPFLDGDRATLINSALDVAIEAMEKESCEDCISRQEVLDKITQVCFSKDQKWVDFRVSYGSRGQRDLIIEFIESLEPVIPQPKVGKWYIESDCEGKTRTLIHKECGFKSNPYVWKNYNFCPECGARMIESEE